MKRDLVIEALKLRFETKVKTRVLAFGSSNTERFCPGVHWLDVFELALRKYGRFHHCINSGVGGETTEDLLARFDSDAAFYQPHMAFITVGGNDSFRKFPRALYKRNLKTLFNKFTKAGTAVVFQTYYAPDPARNDDLFCFYDLMEAMRETAAETGAGLVDQLRRWEILRKAAPEKYLPLMRDGFHLTSTGNMFMGLELASAFGLDEDLPEPAEWTEARALKALVDSLDR